MREGVAALLDREPGLHVVAQASSVAEAVALDVRPDVVITDAALPDARGNEVVVRLRRRYAQAGIFVLIDRDQLRLDEIVRAGTVAGGGVRWLRVEDGDGRGVPVRGCAPLPRASSTCSRPFARTVSASGAPAYAAPRAGRTRP